MLQFWNLFNASVFGTNHSVFKDSRHALGMLSVAIIILVGQILIVEFGGKVFRTDLWILLLGFILSQERHSYCGLVKFTVG